VSASAQNALGGISGQSDITLQNTISITGATATLAEVMAFIQAITYNNTSATPNTTSRSVSVVVNDGTVDSSTRTVAISVANISATSSSASGFSTLNGTNLSPAITFSAEDETLTIGTASHTTGSTADGGGGTDTLSVVTGVDLTAFTTLTGFETLTTSNDAAVTLNEAQHEQFSTITAAGTNTFTIASGASGDGNLTANTAIESYILSTPMALTLANANQSVTGSSSGDSVIIGGATQLGSLNGNGGTDTLSLSDGASIAGATITNFELLNLSNNSSVTMTEAQHDAFSSMVGSGSEQITVTIANDGLIANSNIEKYVLNTANTLTLSTGSQNVTGSSGNDTVAISGLTATGTLTGNGGSDILSMNTGANITGATVTGFNHLTIDSNASVNLLASQVSLFSGAITAPATETITISGDGHFSTLNNIEHFVINDDSTNNRTVTVNASAQTVTASSTTDSITFAVNGVFTGTLTGESSVNDTLSLTTGANIAGATLNHIENLQLASGASISLTQAQHDAFTGTVVATGTETLTLTGSGDFSTFNSIESYIINSDSSGSRTVTLNSATQVITDTSSDTAVTFDLGNMSFIGTLSGDASVADNVSVTNGADITGGTFNNLSTLILGTDTTIAIDAANIGDFATGIVGSSGSDVLKLMDGGTFDFTATTVSGIEALSVGTNNNTTITLTDNFNANGQAVAISNATGSVLSASIEIDASAFVTDTLTITLSNFNGNDIFKGGSGDDVLRPGAGVDTLTGNLGNDSFVGSATELDGDTITDLTSGDKILLTGVNGLSATNVRFNNANSLQVDTNATDFSVPELTLTLDNAAGDNLAFTVEDSGADTLITFIVPNTAPVFDSLNGGATYTINGSAVTLDDNVTVSDTELDALNGGIGNYNNARLTIARNGGASDEDVFSHSGLLGSLTQGGNLTYNNVNVGTVTTNFAGTLVLTFNSNASSNIVDSVLQTIHYANASNGASGLLTFNYTFNDGVLDSTGSNQATVTIEAPNNAPTISGTPETSVNAGSPYQFIPTASDDENDVLTFSVLNKPSWLSLNTATGELSGTPLTSHIDEYQGITLSVSDGTNTQSLAPFTLSVVSGNAAPVISGTPATQVNEGSAYSFTPTVQDADDDTLTFSINNKPSWAEFNTATGELSGTPTRGDVGSHTNIVITVTDGEESVNLASFNVEVSYVNNVPTASDLQLTLAEDSNISFSLDIADMDQDELSITIVSSPEFGLLSEQGSVLVYTPNANYFGHDSFEYSVNDGTVESTTATVSFTISSVNDLPVANPDVYTLDNNDQNSYVLDVLANDTDLDEQQLTIVGASASVGTVSISNGTLVYQAQADTTGVIQIEYLIEDAEQAQSRTTAQLTLTQQLDESPVINLPTDVELNATGLFTKVDLGVPTAFDSEGNPLAVSLVNSNLLLMPGKHLVYWQTADSEGLEAIATQNVNVNPLISLSKSSQVAEDQTHRFSVFLNGESPVYPVTIPYTVAGTADSSDHDLTSGEIVIENGLEGHMNFTVYADMESEGNETITITLADTLNVGANATTTVTIVEANVAPTITTSVEQNNQVRSLVTIGEALVTIKAVAGDVNPTDTVSLTWRSEDDLLTNESMSEDEFVFSTQALSAGIYKVSVTAMDDASPSLSTVNDIYIEVVALLDTLSQQDSDGDLIPDVQEGYSDTDSDGIPDYLDAITECNVMQEQLSDSDKFLVEGEPGICIRKGITVAQNATGGLQVLENELPADEEALNIGGLFSFVASGLPNAGDTYSIVLPQRKPIAQNAKYRKLRNGEWVDFVTTGDNQVLSAAGEPGYCPPPRSDEWVTGLTEGAWCVQLQIVDGGPNDDDGVANRSIIDPGGVAVERTSNQLPQANADESVIETGGTITIDVLANDTDADNDTLTITGATVDFGTVDVIDNQLFYTSPAAFIGEATINYSITDMQGGTSDSTVVINLVTNNAPTAVLDTANTTDRASISIDVLANDTDLDGDTLMVMNAEAVTGSVSINTDGTLQYTPELSFEGVDVINYTIRDSKGAVSSAQVDVTVTAVKSVTISNKSSGGSMGGIGLLLLTVFFMRKKKQLLPCLTLITTSFLASSYASASQWTLEGTVGQAKADKSALHVNNDISLVSFDDKATSWSIGAFYTATQNWKVGFRYIDLGEGEAEFEGETITPGALHRAYSRSTPILPDGFSVEAVYQLPVDTAFNTRFFAGAYRYHYTIDSDLGNSTTLRYENNAIKPYVGADVGYPVGDNAEVLLKYTYYNLSENDVNDLSIGLKVNF